MNDLWAYNWFIDGNKAWFVPCIIENGLMEYDFESGKCCRLTSVIHEKKWHSNYSNLYKYYSTFYFFPLIEEGIVRYNDEEKEQCYQKINGQSKYPLELSKYFENGVDKLFVYSFGLQSVFIFDLKNGIIQGRQKIFDENDLGITYVTRIGRYLYGVSYHSGDVYQYDFEKNVSRQFVIENTSMLSACCSDGEKFWLSGTLPCIYEWRKGEKYAIPIPIKSIDRWDENKGLLAFIDSVFINGKAYFFPFRGNEIVICDNTEMKLIRIDNRDVNKLEVANGMNSTSVVSYCRDKRYIGFYVSSEGKYYELDTVDDSIRKLIINYDRDYEFDRIKGELNSEDSISGYGSLDNYIENISKKQKM